MLVSRYKTLTIMTFRVVVVGTTGKGLKRGVYIHNGKKVVIK